MKNHLQSSNSLNLPVYFTSILEFITSIFNNITAKNWFIIEKKYVFDNLSDPKIEVRVNGHELSNKITTMMYHIIYDINATGGRRIAIQMSNSIDFIVVFFATILTGNYPILVSKKLSFINLKFILQKIKPCFFITDYELKEKQIIEDLAFIPNYSCYSCIYFRKEVHDFPINLKEPTIGVVTDDLQLIYYENTQLLHSINVGLYLANSKGNEIDTTNVFTTDLPFYCLPIYSMLIPLATKRVIICRPNDAKEYQATHRIVTAEYFDEIVTNTISNPWLFDMSIFGYFYRKLIKKRLIKIFSTSIKEISVLNKGIISLIVKKRLAKLQIPYKLVVASDHIGVIVANTELNNKKSNENMFVLNTYFQNLSFNSTNLDELFELFYTTELNTTKSTNLLFKINKKNKLTYFGTADNFIVTPVGFKIYPEVIEGYLLNTLPYVKDCMLIKQSNRFYLLVTIDHTVEITHDITYDEIENVLNYHIKNTISTKFANILDFKGVIMHVGQIDKSKRHLYLD
jgi:hypothetical protein